MVKDKLILPALERLDSPHGRRYRTPEGNLYPSVTTILSATLDHSGLDRWKARVGEEEAARVAGVAATRGTDIHNLCESYVLGEEIDLKSLMPINKMMYLQLKGIIDTRISDVIAVEGQLYSDKLKVAGSVDVISKFDGINSIVDYKTSRRNKDKDWITGYFLQTALYSYCLYERTGIICNQLVVLISVEEENEPQIFIEKATDWLLLAKEMCEKYHASKL